MKFSLFLLNLSVLAITGVTAQKKACEADYIVERCLETEQPKTLECDPTDYSCICAAYQAVLTCYNNCPDDPRAAPASNQVTVYCANASRFASTTIRPTATQAHAATTTGTADEATQTSTGSSTLDVSQAEETGSANRVIHCAGGMLLGIAGVMVFLM